jgi:hypothetical protein
MGRKTQSVLYRIILSMMIITLLLSACELSWEQLIGSGGLEETQTAEARPIEAPSGDASVTFYIKPTIQVSSGIQEEGTPVTTSKLSIASMGTGDFQLTYPAEVQLGSDAIIQLVVAPNSVVISQTQTIPSPQQGQGSLQVIQDRIEVYPYMRAELTSGGAFEVKSDDHSDKAVISSAAVQWNWIVTPRRSGKQMLMLSIAVPIQIGDESGVYELKSISFEILVQESSPVQTEVPTPTPIPSLTDQLASNATTVLEIILTTVVGLATVFITFLKYQLDKKQAAEKKEPEKKQPDKKASKKYSRKER